MKYGNSENSGASKLNLGGADNSIIYKTMPEKDKPAIEAGLMTKGKDDAPYKSFGGEKGKAGVDKSTLTISHEVYKTY